MRKKGCRMCCGISNFFKVLGFLILRLVWNFGFWRGFGWSIFFFLISFCDEVFVFEFFYGGIFF